MLIAASLSFMSISETQRLERKEFLGPVYDPYKLNLELVFKIER